MYFLVLVGPVNPGATQLVCDVALVKSFENPIFILEQDLSFLKCT
jgi:hypothetical protein